TQAWARQLRYAWFDALHANQPNAYIATAHHAEDVAETVLLQLMRGRDPQILKGIHVQSGRLRRPLLAYRKQELVDYLQAIDQPWREDPTNAQTDYLRNHIRHKVLPALTEVHPDPVQQLTQRLSDYQEQQTALQYWLDRETDARMSHSTRRFDLAPDVPDANLQLMLEYWLRTYWMATAGEVQSAIQLLKAQKGRHVAFDEHQLIRESDYLIMREAGTPEEFEPTEIDLYDLTIHVDVPHQQQTLTFKESSGVIALYMMDLDKIQWPVTLRVWQAGDRLQKPGVSKPQKVKDLLTAERITTAEKQGALVLEDQQGLIWVQYVDVAARIFFSEDTSTFLTIHENPLQP
ncbi:MAG: tRNA lysidine(34) synthetase TilS, partial [Bacteroidota bacterium]